MAMPPEVRDMMLRIIELGQHLPKVTPGDDVGMAIALEDEEERAKFRLISIEINKTLDEIFAFAAKAREC
jgi:hypothetical protein